MPFRVIWLMLVENELLNGLTVLPFGSDWFISVILCILALDKH